MNLTLKIQWPCAMSFTTAFLLVFYTAGREGTDQGCPVNLRSVFIEVDWKVFYFLQSTIDNYKDRSINRLIIGRPTKAMKRPTHQPVVSFVFAVPRSIARPCFIFLTLGRAIERERETRKLCKEVKERCPVRECYRAGACIFFFLLLKPAR